MNALALLAALTACDVPSPEASASQVEATHQVALKAEPTEIVPSQLVKTQAALQKCLPEEAMQRLEERQAEYKKELVAMRKNGDTQGVYALLHQVEGSYGAFLEKYNCSDPLAKQDTP
ncbi:hypothetical protein IPG41_04830 [Candidatus Peregrinibacteria bacterium]|nr:MAG: hypothetical protein IPG41_04830 [Candidatus Peregrinibacteria bacterium]